LTFQYVNAKGISGGIMTIPVSDLVDIIEGLSLGERAWFWFCPEAADLGTPLLISPLRSDPTMAGLRDRIADLPLPAGATQCAGLVSVSEAGVLQFGSGMASSDMLTALARWTVNRSTAWPALERLKDAAFLRISDGRVVARYADPELWLGMSAPAPDGSNAASAAALDALKDGQTAWLWMTADGPGGAPFLLARPVSADPTGSAFADAIAATRRRCATTGPVMVGTAHKAPGGGLVLTTAERGEHASDILAALIAAHSETFPMLRGARLFRIKGSKRRELSAPPVLVREQAVLSQPDGAVFWLTDGGSGHPSVLILAGNRAALKAAAKAVVVSDDARTARGTLHDSGKGWLEFRTREAFADFIPTLAAWTTANVPAAPALSRLRDARMTRRDETGTVIDRQRSDDAWTSLS
jgi:hypothetical protein